MECDMRKVGIIALVLVNTVFCYAQDTFTLDNAVQDTAGYFSGRSVGSSYSYYSFPADGGDYFIQWGDGNGNEANGNVSAYWSAANSIENLYSAQRYFYQAYSSYNTPRKISVPSSRYMIIMADRYNSYNNETLAIRYYR
jgi:hypothetical protein